MIILKILRLIASKIKLIMYQSSWRKLNKHNFTTIEGVLPFEKIKVGRYSYGPINASFFGNNKEFLEIGDFCSIGDNVKFLTGGEHYYKGISTYPFKYRFLKKIDYTYEAMSKGAIIVKDDVWIGYGSIILSGVTIGQGAIIGAGSVVGKDVPPYSIFVGNEVRKYRFDKEIVDKMINIDYKKVTEEFFKEHIDYFYNEITEEHVNLFLQKLKELKE